jgi:hypothetical protein
VLNAGEPQLLHEPVLQGLVRPLDPALRLRAVGADDLDVQLAHRPPELGGAVAAGPGHPEDAVLVGVEGHRPAVRLDVAPRRLQVGEGRFALDETEVHELAGRVVDEDEQRAARPAVLEPGVLAAVDLDQLAQAVPAVPGLVDVRAAVLARDPEAGRGHPAPDRLPAEPQVVGLGQLLGRERRAEVGVALADRGQRGLAHRVGVTPVARPRRRETRPSAPLTRYAFSSRNT